LEVPPNVGIEFEIEACNRGAASLGDRRVPEQSRIGNDGDRRPQSK
jgi:hypothetical protein